MTADLTLPEGHVLTLFVVFDRPSDLAHTGKRYCLRPQFVTHRDGETVTMVSNEAWLRDTLEEIRALIPRGLFRMPHQPGEPDVIVETWL